MNKDKAKAAAEQKAAEAGATETRPRYYVGLDVATKKTQVCIVRENGKLFLEKELPTHPAAIISYLRKHCASDIETVALETGGMSSWIYHGLKKGRLPVVVLDALTVHKFLSIKRNKTDVNDARGIAELIRKGLDWLNVVHVKSAACHEIRSLLVIRNQLVKQRVQSEMMVRSVLRLYGGVIDVKGNSQGCFREEAVKRMIDVHDNDNIDLRSRLLPVIDLCHDLDARARNIENELIRLAEADPVCRRFMDIPGVGAIVALSFYTAIEDPKRFKRIEDVGAYFGLTPRVYQSGETDTSGGVSHMGNRLTRTHLVNAANVILTHTQSWSSLKNWGVRLSKKVGYNKAKVAVARKLAIIMLSMWRDNTSFYHKQDALLAFKAARATA
jgi:transposase